MAQKNILIISGEASGDLNAANLAQEIFKNNPEIRICAVGGAHLRQAGARIFYDIKGLSVIGLFDVLKKLPRFFSLQKLILTKIKTEKPDAVIFVDFSGFNLRLAKKINNTIPTIYYISPQVWASRKRRVKTIQKYIRKIIVLFKFEQEFYKKYGITADFVGHPLLDIVRPSMEKKDFLNKFRLPVVKTTVALLPGSRKSEIEHILPLMLKTADLIAQKINNIQFIIAKSPEVDWEIYHQKAHGTQIDLKIIESKTYDCLNAADFCLVASGTATLETAILEKPFVIIYKMNLLNYLLYRPQIKVPYIGMVNLIAQKEIIPEFIQFKAQPEKIAKKVLEILRNPTQMQAMKNSLAQVKSSLGEPGASSRAAQLIITFLK